VSCWGGKGRREMRVGRGSGEKGRRYSVREMAAWRYGFKGPGCMDRWDPVQSPSSTSAAPSSEPESPSTRVRSRITGRFQSLAVRARLSAGAIQITFENPPPWTFRVSVGPAVRPRSRRLGRLPSRARFGDLRAALGEAAIETFERVLHTAPPAVVVDRQDLRTFCNSARPLGPDG